MGVIIIKTSALANLAPPVVTVGNSSLILQVPEILEPNKK